MDAHNNYQLSDDDFSGATGGLTKLPKADGFDVIGTISKLLDENEYEVHFGDGAVVVAAPEEKRSIHIGTPVGLKAIRGGWNIVRELIQNKIR